MSHSEKWFLEQLSSHSKKLLYLKQNISLGEMIKSIRKQLGMSQEVLASRSGVIQSTISRIEKNQVDMTFQTLDKICQALSAQLLVFPILIEPIDKIRKRQARKVAKKRIQYLENTMALEEQKPNTKWLKEVENKETEELLKSNSHLWDE